MPALALALSVSSTLATGCADTPRMQASHVNHEDLTDAPIPAAWVLAGSPKARIKQVAQAPDDGVTVALWDCTAGKFDWYFATDEMVHILKGEVSVTDEQGKVRTLKPGDVAYFEAGMHSIWDVPAYVKKLAVVRDNELSLATRAQRKLGALFSSR